MFEINHTNINITNIDQSLAFYKEALGLQEHHRKEDPEGNYVLVFLTDGHPDHAMIELTWLKGHPTPYNLGENEWHIAFLTDDFEASYQKHKEMGCICFENTQMGVYFISDPDGYWLEIIPKNR